jgi:hypothetical protein
MHRSFEIFILIGGTLVDTTTGPVESTSSAGSAKLLVAVSDVSSIFVADLNIISVCMMHEM